MCGVKSDRTAALLWVAFDALRCNTHWCSMLTAACLSLPCELSSSILLAPRRRQPRYSPCIKHQPASPPRAAADLSKDEQRERERKREGKNSQVTITAGQYFIKMKCSGTVYTAARGTRRVSEPTRVKLLSAGVFLARCV